MNRTSSFVALLALVLALCTLVTAETCYDKYKAGTNVQGVNILERADGRPAIPEHLVVEEDSVRIYGLSKPGTPLVGFLDLHTGRIYFHPAAITLKVDGEGADESQGYKFSAGEYAIVKKIRKDKTKGEESAVPSADKFYKFSVEGHSEEQIPKSARIGLKGIKYLDADAFGFPVEHLGDLKHGDRGSNSKVVMHEQDNYIPQHKFIQHLHPDNVPPAKASSHSAVMALAIGDSVPCIGFALRRHQENWCTAGLAGRIGLTRGMYFSGTSRTCNAGEFKNNGAGQINEAVAKAIYNAITAAFDPECALLNPCPPSFREEGRDLEDEQQLMTPLRNNYF